MDKYWKSFFRRWFTFAFVITVLAGFTYAAVQQAYRQSANDPQIQIAEDAASAIGGGTQITSVVPSNDVDIAQSLAPYMVVYDASGKPLAGNGMLSGALPLLPPGVFSYTRTEGEDRFTWQPQSGVRSAVVITAIGDGAGFVMAGRSLREVESRESALEWMTTLAWLFALVGSALLEMLYNRGKSRLI